MSLLTELQAAEHLNRPRATLTRWRHEGFGPAYVRLGRGIRYKLDDLDAWIDANRIDPNGEARR